VAAIALWAWSASASAQQGPATIVIATVVQREVTATQTFVGTVNPLRRSTVGSAVDGRVIEFLVEAGDRVSQGQPLARLLTETLQIEIAAARAEHEFRLQELAELVNGSRPEEIEQAQAHMAGAKALMEYALAKYQRAKSLFDQGQAVTKDQMELERSASVQAEQAYYEAKAAYELMVAGPRQERIARARAYAQVQEEQVRRLEDQLKKHTVLAPFDGYVVAEHTEVGYWIARGEPVADIIEIDQVDVEVMVLESYVSQLRRGSKARVELDALPGREFAGEVTYIVPQADVRSRNFPVRVRLANESLSDGNPLLKPGMFARVTLPVQRKGEALLVPKDAVVLGGESPMVYIVELDSKDPRLGQARPVPVTLGVPEGELVEVIGELKAGQHVVVEGNERLHAPWKVRIANHHATR
jgi:RND family efflux transporter MFP subunit